MSNPAASFEPYRRRLLGLAYRMSGSMADAEDAVQETYLRWHGVDRDKVLDPRGFLMTTTTRICLDMLTSARARREEYVGQWLPEPVLDTAALAPDSHTELAEDLSIALLLTLDRLSPLERAAFLLHDVFDFSFSEVAPALERSEAACRQLAARARGHVRAARPRGATAPGRSGKIDAKHAQLMSAFAAATRSGDLNALTRLLAGDVRVVTDGGGKVRAALNVVDGADRAARFLVDVARPRAGAWWRDDFTLRFATINGLPGVIVDSPEGPVQTTAFEIEGDVVRALYVVRNPAKLRHLAVASVPDESDRG
jgi:RNA polymerase sigma-70 factor, ECF subfamily